METRNSKPDQTGALAAFARVNKFIEEAVGDFCNPLHNDLSCIYVALSNPIRANTEALNAVEDIERHERTHIDTISNTPFNAQYLAASSGVLKACAVIRAALSAPVLETKEQMLTRIFGPLPEQRIDPLAAITALREYFQEVQVCGVHHRITGALNHLEKHIKMMKRGPSEPESNSAAVLSGLRKLGEMGLEIPPHEPDCANVREIVTAYLTANGFDGLYQPGECACKISDLFICEGCPDSCKPGYIHPGDGIDYKYFITADKVAYWHEATHEREGYWGSEPEKEEDKPCWPSAKSSGMCPNTGLLAM